MKKIVIILLASLAVIPCSIWAQTQPGHVRTVSRPNAPSENISGVMLRVRGNHNAVLSDEQGQFQLLMQGLEPGQAYALTGVIKAGYQLREPELIGRNQSFSTSVPLEIVMISTKMLYAEQQKIEEQARANAEANYFKKLTELDNALAEAKLTNEAYEAQLNELSEQYARFEPLLQTISRYYALIDYDGRDTLSARISERIEAGDLDEAERLIKAKGAVAEREKQLKELEQLQQFMRKDLAEDCYNLFTICFERFEQDSAEYYICKRAELDTTNVEYQLRAGQFLMVYRAKYDEAEKYFFRALRLAEQQYGKTSGDVATAFSELGENYSHKGDYQQALNYLNRSAKISEELRGKESIAMAQSHSNLGALYHKMGRSKEAIGHMQEALRLYERLCPETDPQIPQARNNLGNALFQSKQYLEAQKCFEQALKEYTACYGEKHFDVAIVYNNLASIAFVQGRYAEADNLFVKALELFTRILGPQHPRTKQTQKNLEYLRKGIKS